MSCFQLKVVKTEEDNLQVICIDDDEDDVRITGAPVKDEPADDKQGVHLLSRTLYPRRETFPIKDEPVVKQEHEATGRCDALSRHVVKEEPRSSTKTTELKFSTHPTKCLHLAGLDPLQCDEDEVSLFRRFQPYGILRLAAMGSEALLHFEDVDDAVYAASRVSRALMGGDRAASVKATYVVDSVATAATAPRGDDNNNNVVKSASTESPGVLVIAPKVEDVHETITSSLGSSLLCNESDERVQAGDTSVAEIQRHVSERIHAIRQQLPLEITGMDPPREEDMWAREPKVFHSDVTDFTDDSSDEEWTPIPYKTFSVGSLLTLTRREKGLGPVSKTTNPQPRPMAEMGEEDSRRFYAAFVPDINNV